MFFLSFIEAEMRRRTWWTIYILDPEDTDAERLQTFSDPPWSLEACNALRFWRTRQTATIEAPRSLPLADNGRTAQLGL